MKAALLCSALLFPAFAFAQSPCAGITKEKIAASFAHHKWYFAGAPVRIVGMSNLFPSTQDFGYATATDDNGKPLCMGYMLLTADGVRGFQKKFSVTHGSNGLVVEPIN